MCSIFFWVNNEWGLVMISLKIFRRKSGSSSAGVSLRTWPAGKYPTNRWCFNGDFNGDLMGFNGI